MTTLTTEEVLKMAEEVGLGFVVDRHWMCHKELEAFAKLVADKSASVEREACAELAENCDPRANHRGIASAIRLRGTHE